jgi:hypothetical protein
MDAVHTIPIKEDAVKTRAINRCIRTKLFAKVPSDIEACAVRLKNRAVLTCGAISTRTHTRSRTGSVPFLDLFN